MTETNRARVRGHINTYFKETQFDLSDEGHNRMIMEGGYGAGSTDKEGNILNPLASELCFWELDPNDFKDPRRPHEKRFSKQNANSGQAGAFPTTIRSPMLNSPTRSTTRSSPTLPSRCGRMAFTSSARGRTAAIQNSASSTTGGTRAKQRLKLASTTATQARRAKLSGSWSIPKRCPLVPPSRMMYESL